MFLERGDDYASLVGVFIVEDNAITVGAYSYLCHQKTDTDKKLTLWIHERRYTNSLLRVGQKVTFSLVNDFATIFFCGHTTGRVYKKLELMDIESDGEYRYIRNSDYVTFGKIIKLEKIVEHTLVIIGIEKTLKNVEGERWVEV